MQRELSRFVTRLEYLWKVGTRPTERGADAVKKGAVPLRGRAHVTKVSACVVSPNSPLTKLLTTEWRVSGLVTWRG